MITIILLFSKVIVLYEGIYYMYNYMYNYIYDIF